MSTNMIFHLPIVQGVAKFKFPPALSHDNGKNFIICHSITSTDYGKELGYVISNISYYQESVKYHENTLAIFERSEESGPTKNFAGTIRAPINRVHDQVYLYTVDSLHRLLKINGEITIEIAGPVEDRIWI